MEHDTLAQRLSLISTHWSLLNQAHQQGDDAARAALHRLLERYGGAVRRYLLGALRDVDAADELFQDFACRLLNGSLRGANPERGRFRDYLKGVLSHLAADHHRRAKRRLPPLPNEFAEPAADGTLTPEADVAFRESWRDELLARAWQALEEVERTTAKPFHAVLRLRADHPELHSPELAERLSAQLGKPVTAVGVRQLLHRARERFADLLLEEVWVTLVSPTLADLNEELRELGLLDYCRPALERRLDADADCALA